MRIQLARVLKRSEKEPASPSSPQPNTPPQPTAKDDKPKRPSNTTSDKSLRNRPLVVSPPYGNLAERCRILGQDIVNEADYRKSIMPRVADGNNKVQVDQYWDWYKQNDGIVHARFWNECTRLQQDLRVVNIRDTRLDDLLETHARNVSDRMQRPDLANQSPMIFHCSIEDIRETGERFLYLAKFGDPNS